MWYVFVRWSFSPEWERWNLGESDGLGMKTEQEAQVELAKAVFEYSYAQFCVKFVEGEFIWCPPKYLKD